MTTSDTITETMTGFKPYDIDFVIKHVTKYEDEGWTVADVSVNVFAEVLVFLNRPRREGCSQKPAFDKEGNPIEVEFLTFFKDRS